MNRTVNISTGRMLRMQCKPGLPNRQPDVILPDTYEAQSDAMSACPCGNRPHNFSWADSK